MSLPKIVTPEFETVIPSSREGIKFRPFLVKEEKILYIALESGEVNDIKNALLSVIESCILTPGVNVNELATYDIEYLLLRIRAKSVGENIKVNLKHQKSECQHETPYQLNLEEIKVNFNEEHKDIIRLNGNIGIKMKIPSLNKFLSLQNNEGIDGIFNLILNSVEYIFDGDDIYQDFKEEEFKEFIDSLTQDQFSNIKNFFDTMPKLYHDVSWECAVCKETETVRLEGLQSFFM
jgi:hypothetical protein